MLEQGLYEYRAVMTSNFEPLSYSGSNSRMGNNAIKTTKPHCETHSIGNSTTRRRRISFHHRKPSVDPAVDKELSDESSNSINSVEQRRGAIINLSSNTANANSALSPETPPVGDLSLVSGKTRPNLTSCSNATDGHNDFQQSKSTLNSPIIKGCQGTKNKMVTLSEQEVFNLKDIVLLHLDLVQQQRQVIQEKDKLIAQLRTETSTLKTRLDRMDRRLSTKADTSSSRVHHSESIKAEITKSKGKQLSAKVEKYHPGRVQKSAKATLKQQKKTMDGLHRVASDYHTTQVIEYEELAEETIPNSCDIQSIEVPSYRIQTFNTCHSLEGTEDIEEQTYHKRHQRHENEEKRRKRWDLQRLREQQMIENLKKNQSINRLAPPPPEKPNLEAIFPKAENAQYLEICNSLPVNVFGHPLPEVSPAEFSIPWHKPKKSKHKRSTR